MSRVLIALSGGLDSAVLLAQALDEKIEATGEPAHTVGAINFGYGSKHNPYEYEMAGALAKHYKVPLNYLNVRDCFLYTSSVLLDKQAGSEIPEGHYEEESMKQTVVPFRNGIFLSILASIAESQSYSEIRIGAHAGDHFIYPDCRRNFMAPMGLAIKVGTDGKVNLKTPLLYADKKGIVECGMDLKVPFHLTRTCYKPQEVACGKCGSCQERLEAFHLNGITDPIEYESRELMSKPTPSELPT